MNRKEAYLFALGATAVAVLEDGHLALAAFDEAADVLLVGKQHQQGYGDGKDAVELLGLIEDNEDEDGESQAGKYGAERYPAGNIEDEDKNAYAAKCDIGLDAKDHSEEGGYTLAATEVGPDGKNMPDHGGEAEAKLHIYEVEIAFERIRKKEGQLYGDDGFEHVDDHDERAPFGAEHTVGIGSAGVAAAVIANIDAEENSTYPDSRRNTANKVG